MKKNRLDIIGLSSSHSQVGHFALVLGEAEGNRRLPIIIGGAEAQAIALELENVKTNRPMTHDLIYNLATHFDIQLVEVVINNLHEGIFYARLVLEHEGELHEIDSRPSDAIAIAVRFKAPIYVHEHVLDEAGIVVQDEDSGDSFLSEVEKAEEVQEESQAAGQGQDERSRLTRQLEEALEREDYERAAQLRDKLKKLG